MEDGAYSRQERTRQPQKKRAGDVLRGARSAPSNWPSATSLALSHRPHSVHQVTSRLSLLLVRKKQRPSTPPESDRTAPVPQPLPPETEVRSRPTRVRIARAAMPLASTSTLPSSTATPTRRRRRRVVPTPCLCLALAGLVVPTASASPRTHLDTLRYTPSPPARLYYPRAEAASSSAPRESKARAAASSTPSVVKLQVDTSSIVTGAVSTATAEIGRAHV